MTERKGASAIDIFDKEPKEFTPTHMYYRDEVDPSNAEGLKYIETRGLLPFIPRIVIEQLRDGIEIPKYKSEGDSGMDFFSPVTYVIAPSESVKADLGLIIELPVHPFHQYGYRWELQIRQRSGASFHTNLVVKNSPGTIDNFYRDELAVLVRNSNPLNDEKVKFAFNLKGEKVDIDNEVPYGTLIIEKGDRFAQGIITQVNRPLEIVVGEVNREVDRGGGIGSSGLKG